MQLIKVIVCISVLVTRICFAGFTVKTAKLDESSLVRASIDILESCYADRFSTVGLSGPSVGRIMTEISSRDTMISVTLIDETSAVESHNPVDRWSRYKLQIFVITVTSPSILVETLTHVKRSKWWNHMASFLLIDLPIAENGCANAPEVLMEAWKMDLLNAKFVCLHQTRRELIYTFNPYTNKMPIPWRQENTYKGINDHPWTLFVREYRENDSHCNGLDFDKTVELGGYEIRASVEGMERWWFADPDQEPTLINYVRNITAEILMGSLNATWTMLARPRSYTPLINIEQNETYGIAAEVTSGTSDICLNIVHEHRFGGFGTTYPLWAFPVGILTQYPGHKSQLDKIISVLDRRSRIGVLVVFLITLLFIKFWLGKPLILSILDLVLLICNTGLRRIPQNTSPRIYLASLFIFVVTIQGIYSGQFASLLTKKVRLRNIDTIEDLARSGHTIYGREGLRFLFNQPEFDGRYVTVEGVNCVEYVLQDPKAACVEVITSLLDAAKKSNLHLSRESIGVIYETYLIRPDWPLEERVNTIYGRVASGAIAETLYRRRHDTIMRSIKSFENHEQEPEVKVITLKQLRFAFVLLGIGLGCATIVFIIEVATFGTEIANLWSRIWR